MCDVQFSTYLRRRRAGQQQREATRARTDWVRRRASCGASSPLAERCDDDERNERDRRFARARAPLTKIVHSSVAATSNAR